MRMHDAVIWDHAHIHHRLWNLHQLSRVIWYGACKGGVKVDRSPAAARAEPSGTTTLLRHLFSLSFQHGIYIFTIRIGLFANCTHSGYHKKKEKLGIDLIFSSYLGTTKTLMRTPKTYCAEFCTLLLASFTYYCIYQLGFCTPSFVQQQLGSRLTSPLAVGENSLHKL